MSKLFGGKDPFDDPFFTEPFAGHVGSRKEITIEELDNDGNVSVPNTQVAAVSKTQAHKSHESNCFSFRRVAYGGVNGMYYSSSIGQRIGNDGVVLLEIKEEDKTLGQALHTISRGIHDMGHTLTKKRNPDGKEDSLQILHNLNEDELDGFEENWKVNADKHIPGWNDGFDSIENTGLEAYSHLGWNGEGAWDGWTLPWTDMWGTDGTMVPAGEPSSGSSTTKVKKAIYNASDLQGNFPSSFPNLKTFELTTTIDAFTMNVLILILKCCPSLESLHLIIQEGFIGPEYWELDDVETRRFLTRHLKRVEFLEFNGEKQKLDIARFLLEHGNALEEMIFSWRDKIKYHEKSTETMNQMSKFNKASSTVKLIALLKE